MIWGLLASFLAWALDIGGTGQKDYSSGEENVQRPHYYYNNNNNNNNNNNKQQQQQQILLKIGK